MGHLVNVIEAVSRQRGEKARVHVFMLWEQIWRSKGPSRKYWSEMGSAVPDRLKQALRSTNVEFQSKKSESASPKTIEVSLLQVTLHENS